MGSRAISRLLLILALIVAAHVFKPISSQSVIEQMLSAAESLSFVMPDFAEVRIAQASYLAAAFGQRDADTSSRGARSNAAVSMPAVLGFGQSTERTPCGKSEVKPTLAKARPVRTLAARTQPRVKQIIPDLPEAMPLSRALALTFPLADVELISMPGRRSTERHFRRTLFVPLAIKPMLPRRLTSKAECDATTVVAIESLTEVPQTEGPREEEFELGESVEAGEAAATEETVAPATRNCPVQIPETLVPQQ